jgi:hypothetical protein
LRHRVTRRTRYHEGTEKQEKVSLIGLGSEW